MPNRPPSYRRESRAFESQRTDSAEYVDLLRGLLEQERSALAIDLKDVSHVDRDAVKLLALCESNGAELRNCAAYIREWVTREADGGLRGGPK